MKVLQRLLLLPCVVPLLAVLVVACLNLKQPVSLRVLVWRSPSWSLGGWLFLGGASGAILAAGAGISRPENQTPLRRKVHQAAQEPEPFFNNPRSEQWQETRFEATQDFKPQQASPERDVRDPSPTVAVPFRVIRKGARNRQAENDHHPRQPHQQPEETSPANTYESEIQSDSWSESISEDW